jgi:hypothetical protein
MTCGKKPPITDIAVAAAETRILLEHQNDIATFPSGTAAFEKRTIQILRRTR